MNTLSAFYRNEATDHAGRTLANIWQYSHDQLEFHHDFIQWLFPLELPSPVNPYAPMLDPPTAAAFRADPALLANLQRSLTLMLDFYGLDQSSPDTPITRAASFSARSPNWLRRGNHNHLRLTRILHCLALCGLTAQANHLLAALLAIAADFPNTVTPATLNYWREAVRT